MQCVKCNFSKCKEMVFRKKGHNNVLDTVQNISQYPELCILGLHFRKKIVGSLFASRISWPQLINVYIFLELLGRTEGIVRRSWINYSAL